MNSSVEMENIFYLEPDPRVKEWFLIDSPISVGAMLVSYLLFVTKLGPLMMQSRQEFELKIFMMIYNIIQIIYCAALVLTSAIPLMHFNLHCARLTFSEEDIILPRLSYAFFLLKVVDLLDTIIFVLRKKNNQVSFLHVYHHIYAVLLGYINTKYLSGSQIPILTLLNSAVHVLMYYYYTITAISKRSIWWKKYLTSFQLVHLAIMLAIMLPTILNPTCQFPKMSIVLIMFLPTALLFREFHIFYKKAYVKQMQSAKWTAINFIYKSLKVKIYREHFTYEILGT